jgi:signal transduction histidine kinase
MTGQAREWSDADTGMRFGLGPPRDELTQLAATLDDLLDRVAGSLRHEQQFSAELSHELRTPLTSVITEAQLALRHPLTDDQYRDGYERVLDSARQMQRTLDTLLTAARVEVGRARGVGDAAAAAQAAAKGSGGRVAVVEPAAPIGLGVDTDVAERVLAPLVENAVRHADQSVTITIGRRNGSALFTVADDGPGVAEGDRAKIFDPGFGRDGGAGLGLPLARRLARAAGGEIQLEQAANGARFTVRLPVA